MEPEIKTACVRAAAKLGMGLSLLAAVIGIRLVTATSSGVESGIRELERLESQIESESTVTASDTDAAEPVSDDSIGARLSTGVRNHFSGSEPGTRGGEKLVSCRLADGIHFMRADDCAMRGGQSTVVSRDR